jgi:hypothetical protein
MLPITIAIVLGSSTQIHWVVCFERQSSISVTRHAHLKTCCSEWCTEYNAHTHTHTYAPYSFTTMCESALSLKGVGTNLAFALGILMCFCLAIALLRVWLYNSYETTACAMIVISSPLRKTDTRTHNQPSGLTWFDFEMLGFYPH